jgi:hypothetical protein
MQEQLGKLSQAGDGAFSVELLVVRAGDGAYRLV